MGCETCVERHGLAEMAAAYPYATDLQSDFQLACDWIFHLLDRGPLNGAASFGAIQSFLVDDYTSNYTRFEAHAATRLTGRYMRCALLHCRRALQTLFAQGHLSRRRLHPSEPAKSAQDNIVHWEFSSTASCLCRLAQTGTFWSTGPRACSACALLRPWCQPKLIPAGGDLCWFVSLDGGGPSHVDDDAEIAFTVLALPGLAPTSAAELCASLRCIGYTDAAPDYIELLLQHLLSAGRVSRRRVAPDGSMTGVAYDDDE
jgi:hypothetical protein